MARPAGRTDAGRPPRCRSASGCASTPDSTRLLLEFIRQYRGLRSDAEAEAVRQAENWQFTGTPPTVDDEQARRGYVLLSVVDRQIVPATPEQQRARQRYFQRLSREQREEITAATDRGFRKRTTTSRDTASATLPPIAAGILSEGVGTVAVLGAGTAFGIGAYQAVEEFRRYESRTAAAGAGLLSDDPSSPR